MDRIEELLKRYGLVPRIEFADNIRKLLLEEIENKSARDSSYLKTLCIQLFGLGYVEDSLLIWRAKERDFDTHCYIDVQLLCGAGLEKTLNYLEQLDSLEAREIIKYIHDCEEGGDFDDFNVDEILKYYKHGGIY